LVGYGNNRVPRKFKSNRFGPFKIVANLGKNVFALQDPQTLPAKKAPSHTEQVYQQLDKKFEFLPIALPHPLRILLKLRSQKLLTLA
jgi:hypothetical protein